MIEPPERPPAADEAAGTTPLSTSLARRDDIDGLRGLAVAAVVLFHAFPRLLPGGFAGVDVFFVLSGFLITSILEREVDRGGLRLGNFWGRRVRRLFPALALLLATTLVAGWLLFTPDEFARLGRETAAGASFTANFLFASEQGYFDERAQFRPLLHLWSLAIEEQFYLAWPLLLWLLHRSRVPRAPALVVLFAGSFAWNLFLTKAQPKVGFFSALARLWELGLGGLIATVLPASDRFVARMRAPGNATAASFPGPATGAGLPSWARDLVSVVGLALVVRGLAVSRTTARYPGTAALWPTVGTALVVMAGERAWANRALLRRRTIVWLGLVSYPLYLWHWPPLAFAWTIVGGQPPPALRLALVALALPLAWLTWRLAEIPVRDSPRPAVATLRLVGCVVALGAIGAALAASNGAPVLRPGPVAVREGAIGLEPLERLLVERFSRCTVPHCWESRPTDAATVVILGDSHAHHLFPGLAEALPGENVRCRSSSALPLSTDPALGRIVHEAADDPSVRTVVLSALWTRHSERLGKDPALRQTVDLLTSAGKNVILIGNVPNFRITPRGCKYSPGDEACRPPLDEEDLRGAAVKRLRAAVAGNPRAAFVDLAPLLRDGHGFSMQRGGRVLYRDGNHLNFDGSRRVAQPIAAAIRELESRPQPTPAAGAG